MRDLSLHVLDVVENSLRAGATAVAVTVQADRERDLLALTVEDDGPGFAVSPERACDPFYTTKSGKRVGLGLSLFRAAAERAGGGLRIAASPMGGAKVEARMRLSHVDRSPMGDLAATVAAIVATNPALDLRVTLAGGRAPVTLGSRQIAESMGPAPDGLAVATRVAELVRADVNERWDGPV